MDARLGNMDAEELNRVLSALLVRVAASRDEEAFEELEEAVFEPQAANQ